MRKILAVSIAALLMGSFVAASAHEGGMKNEGEAEFKEHCAICHPDGGNIVTPQKTLHKKSLEANKIATAADIVKVMRNPGPGMPPFDEKAVPDEEAKAIAEYILKTFK